MAAFPKQKKVLTCWNQICLLAEANATCQTNKPACTDADRFGGCRGAPSSLEAMCQILVVVFFLARWCF